MSTNTAHPDPVQYAVYNGAGQAVETATSQQEAYGVIDYLTRTAPADGPYRTGLALIEDAR